MHPLQSHEVPCRPDRNGVNSQKRMRFRDPGPYRRPIGAIPFWTVGAINQRRQELATVFLAGLLVCSIGRSARHSSCETFETLQMRKVHEP